MTKFIYLSDSHCGADPRGYQQQRAYPEWLPEIVAALRDTIEREGNIDFVLHGGDLVDFTSEESILAAAKLFEFGIPVYLCLGNHDLTTPDALQTWLLLAPQFFPGGQPNYSISTEDCIIHVVPNQWGDESYHWHESQAASFSDEQRDFLEAALSRARDRPHLLLTHAPTFDLPIEQTGSNEDLHAPDPAFTATIVDLVARYPHLRCVLGAHSHLNMSVQNAGAQFVTTSALDETPFEFKLFEVTRQSIAMTTVNLSRRIGKIGEYDWNKTFVQGRAVDRAFLLPNSPVVVESCSK